VISPAFVDIGGDCYGLRFFTAPVDSDNDQIPDVDDNCPQDPNPDQLDLENDGIGDVCDPEDDNDGVNDVVDNCPIDANPSQWDSDLDGIGNECDPQFGSAPILNEVDSLVAQMVAAIQAVDPPGANGLIKKLSGKNGSVNARVADAVSDFVVGSIAETEFVDRLLEALDKLDAFDNQLSAKIDNGQIPSPEAADLVDWSLEIRDLIEFLILTI